ncbi:SpaA isopeptide-forming pilin-related protein [Adlercreutzia caecimuris]|uniref:SpaA isopeptide-forming pilin-related protein n=1 Tax=Adlercreutzia caecimuris TaxID=671266 RepID=UPI002494F7ED|nr:FctA domain-containing protein [Adlercreutzia caecimuris]
MTKLLQNKPLIKFLGIALSILLVVALVPQISIAYGSKDDIADETALAETGENAATEGEEVAADGEGDATPEGGTDSAEGDEAVEGEVVTIDGVEMVSHKVEVPGEEPEDDEAAPQSDEGIAVAAEEPDEKNATRSEDLVGNSDHEIKAGEEVTNTNGPLTFSGNGKSYTLTVNGTLKSDIKVIGGATLTIKGSGAIIGYGEEGQGSVIVVEGKGSKLVFGEIKDGVSSGPTVTGGTGRSIPNKNKWVIWNEVGGGIHVCRAQGNSEEKNASLEFRGGTVSGNTAEAGGGIFIDYRCGFTMSGGSILENTATKHEGGGIFTWGNWNGKTGNGSRGYGEITAATIKGNKTATTTDWGGGGIYINNDGILRIESARITLNKAEGLGGGVAGCPHAEIGIGKMQNGAAVYDNKALGGVGPKNSGLKFNMPDSLTHTGMKVPSGDFLVQGLAKDEIPVLTDKSTDSLPYGNDGYNLLPGNYAKGEFDSSLAKDFYCTYASFIAATNLKSHPKDENGKEIAWNGFIAGIAANKVNGKAVSENAADGTQSWTAAPISIPVNEDYEIHDATLCLTSTAEEDKSGIARTVFIEDNESSTHGGGIACNGTLFFGDFPQKEEIVNGYTLPLNKEVISGITGKKLNLQEGETFSFVLTDKATGDSYKASSNEKGEINFTNLPGLKESTEKTFTLTEEKKDGYTSSIGEGAEVKVQLNVEKSSVTYGSLTTTTYATTVAPGSIKINGTATDTVTNTLNLTASAEIPVTKIADGIGAGEFTFKLNEITDGISNVVADLDKPTLVEGVDLGALANEGKESVAVDVDDSTSKSEQNTGTFTLNYKPKAAEETHWYAIAEQAGTTPGVVYDPTAYLVKVTTTLADDGRSLSTSKVVYKTVPDSRKLQEVSDEVGVVFNNVATPKGSWQFQADKFFCGIDAPSDCSFTLQEIERVPEAGEPLENVLVSNDNLQKWTASLSGANFTDNHASIEFPEIAYEQQGDGEGFQNDVGDHYYLVTEDGDDVTKDTTAYVIKVNVALDETNSRNLTVAETVMGYADDINSALNSMPEGERPAFYNTDTYGMISAASYSVYAASGEPVDQVCYVDPKIIKNLEGRAIKSGEFAFKLIEVANYNDTEGTVISATTNDEFGMVDFDKANNVSGDLENPSCLAYTKPGTYYYRVIEDTSKGGMNDQSVLYSDQVITFTTVIEQDEATGRLVCTDMYYGYWDKAASKNVRYDEQYTDFDTQPGNIGDMSKLNPDWHPTITNKTRPMDLQVRKTSVSDRNEGLVGATYGLYMVNENAQGDIWLAEATSEDGGWITYKNVSLSTNNLYYFKETAAPAGHTVSEFRSSYFYLVENASSANGYTLQYTDSKYLPEAAADEAAVQAEVSGTVQAKNVPAAQADTEAANEAAADTETQPGYSADGNVLLTYDKDGGVYDEVTTLEVNKLDTRTHEWVEGAKLVILEKESGKEIASWTSSKAPQKLEKTLNVGTTYLLREVEAPDQYRLANDVEFVIDDYGNVSITKGTENGNAELSDNTISLYDTMLDAEETETIEREKSTTEKPNKDTLLAKTGDMLPILGIVLVALAALIVVIVAVRRRRAGEDSASNE